MVCPRECPALDRDGVCSRLNLIGIVVILTCSPSTPGVALNPCVPSTMATACPTWSRRAAHSLLCLFIPPWVVAYTEPQSHTVYGVAGIRRSRRQYVSRDDVVAVISVDVVADSLLLRVRELATDLSERAAEWWSWVRWEARSRQVLYI